VAFIRKNIICRGVYFSVCWGGNMRFNWLDGKKWRKKRKRGKGKRKVKGEGGGVRKGKNHTQKTVTEMISKNAPLSYWNAKKIFARGALPPLHPPAAANFLRGLKKPVRYTFLKLWIWGKNVILKRGEGGGNMSLTT